MFNAKVTSFFNTKSFINFYAKFESQIKMLKCGERPITFLWERRTELLFKTKTTFKRTIFSAEWKNRDSKIITIFTIPAEKAAKPQVSKFHGQV